MRIHVTQEHVDHGRQCSTMWCPVALALRDAGFDWAIVRSYEITVKKDGKEIAVPSTDEINDFECRFDNGLMVGPTEFEVPGLELT